MRPENVETSLSHSAVVDQLARNCKPRRWMASCRGILLLCFWPMTACAQGYSEPEPQPRNSQPRINQPQPVLLPPEHVSQALQLRGLSSVGESSPYQYWLPQKSSARVTWLPGSSDDLGITQTNLSASFGRPIPGGRGMISLTPSFGITMLNGPVKADLPSRLYNASINLSWMNRINDRMNVVVGVSPGINSDFENLSSGAFRMMGFASGTWQCNPEWQFQFGVAVLGRDDIPALPVAGLIWTPNEDTRIEFAAPRPRFARRIIKTGSGLFAGENWVYLAGEFGGGTWAIERESGREDEVTLRDFRLVLGFETKSKTAPNWLIETGYVFGREIEFESNTPDIEPGETVLFRTGLSF